MIRAAVSLLLLLSVLPVSAQEQPFSERVDVNLVLVDATVTDRSGNQILGLTKDDFIIRENGVVQEIASAEYFTNRRLLDSPESKAAFKVERVREERFFILFFHKILGGPREVDIEIRRARDAAIQFVEKEMLPEDRVAVAGFDARLNVYADFTSDKKILLKALNEVVTYSKGLASVPAYAGEVSIMRNVDRAKLLNDTGRIYDALEYLADTMPEVRARKVLILFSVGIGQRSSFSSQIPENEDHWYLPMLHALNRENISVYTVNLLRNVIGSYAEEQTLHRLARETGGEYFRPGVSFIGPLRAVERENNGYYLLSYYSKKPENASGYQKIDVSLRNREFRVKAREGYAY
jgi:VWFA-related protein